MKWLLILFLFSGCAISKVKVTGGDIEAKRLDTSLTIAPKQRRYLPETTISKGVEPTLSSKPNFEFKWGLEF